jgi:hypothetical protein
VRSRLARVAGLTSRILAARTPTEHAEEVLKALEADYGDLDTFEGADPPDHDRLGLLATVLALDDVAVDLLAVAVAPDLDANLGLAFGLLEGGAAPSAATVGLALELCGLPTAEERAAEVLLESGVLRAEGLLDVVGDRPWLQRPLRVADRVRSHLVGVDAPDPAVAALVVLPVRFACPAADELASHLDQGSPLTWLRARPGSAGATAATAAFAAFGVGALVVDLRLADPAAAVLPPLAGAALEAAMQGSGLVVAGAERLLDAPDGARAVRRLTDARVPVVAVADRPWSSLGLPPATVEAAVLTATERAGIWAEQLGDDLDGLAGRRSVATMRMAPDQIVQIAARARQLAAARGVELTGGIVREAARLLRPHTAGADLRSGSRQSTGLDDLVLPDRTMAELVRLVGWATHRDDVLSHGNVHGKGSKGIGLTALFTGSPGTGKTLATHVIADELGLDLLQIDLSAVVDKYIGETEKKLENIFLDAESRDVLLFFDEADSLFGSRSAVQDARDRYANQEVSYLLQRMEHFDGITILATNLRGNLDAAFSRRLNFIVHFPDPDVDTRRQLWRQHLEQTAGIAPDDPVDVDRLAEVAELAGGDIRNVVLAAAYDAACEDSLIGMRHLREATIREYTKLGRRIPSL